MSKKSNLNHQFINEIKKECKFKKSKHLAKQKAKEEAKKNHEDYKQVKGIYSTKTYKDYCESLRIFTNYIEYYISLKETKDDGDTRKSTRKEILNWQERSNKSTKLM